MTTHATKHTPLDFGVPYANINDDNSVDCPVCGQNFPPLTREFWKDSETPMTGYEAHYAARSDRGD
jgi:hypothetical protein